MNKKNISKLLIGMFIITSLFTGCSSKNVSAETKNNSPVQTQSVTNDNSTIETYFTKKEGNLNKILINQINTAQKNLNVAIYSLTKQDIADAIISAKNRGVDVKVITDKQESASKYQKVILDKFKSVGIPVKINSHAGLMHLKVTIIDDKIACGGSYNYTESATKNNDENLIIMKDSNIVKEYLDEYNTMWNNNTDYINY